MFDEGAVHRPIERPSSIAGYRPRHWCAVCRLSAEQSRDLHCTKADYPNLCYADCLLDDPEFDRGSTGQLKVRTGIRDQWMVFLQDQTHTLPVPPEPTGSADLIPSLEEE